MKKHKYIGEKTNWRGVRFTLTGYPESDNPMHNGILVMIEIDGESMGWIEHESENDKGWFMRASSKFNMNSPKGQVVCGFSRMLQKDFPDGNIPEEEVEESIVIGDGTLSIDSIQKYVLLKHGEQKTKRMLKLSFKNNKKAKAFVQNAQDEAILNY
tara:strand:+ start:96 stop:563 length:468 start_codon:yes stop_codon:yes gene_type:complete